MSGAPIVFNYANWTATFPELSGITSVAATNYFNIATSFVDNSGCSPVQDATLLTNVLYLTTAHVAALLSTRTDGIVTTGGAEAPSPLVGRPNSITEGSVTVSAELPAQPASAAWWNQTTYGAMAWVLLRPYRTLRAIPSPRCRIYNPPVGPYWGGGSWGGY